MLTNKKTGIGALRQKVHQSCSIIFDTEANIMEIVKVFNHPKLDLVLICGESRSFLTPTSSFKRGI